MIEVGAEPLRQVGDPPRQGRSAGRTAASGPRPDDRDRARGRLRASYADGDNSGVVATDTMKNTVYALARRAPDRRDRGVRARSSAGTSSPSPQVERRPGHDRRARLACRSATRRTRSPATGRRRGRRSWPSTRDGARRRGRDRRPDGDEDDPVGVRGLPARPSSRPWPRPTTGSWRRRSARRGAYDAAATVDFDASFEAVRATFLEVFADHDRVSVQALDLDRRPRRSSRRHPEVAEVSMSLPNLHHWTVDLSPFGIENDREVYVVDDRAARADRGDDPRESADASAASGRDRLGVTRRGRGSGHGSPHRPAPDQRDPRRRRPDRHRAPRRPRPGARRASSPSASRPTARRSSSGR